MAEPDDSLRGPGRSSLAEPHRNAFRPPEYTDPEDGEPDQLGVEDRTYQAEPAGAEFWFETLDGQYESFDGSKATFTGGRYRSDAAKVLAEFHDGSRVRHVLIVVDLPGGETSGDSVPEAIEVTPELALVFHSRNRDGNERRRPPRQATPISLPANPFLDPRIQAFYRTWEEIKASAGTAPTRPTPVVEPAPRAEAPSLSDPPRSKEPKRSTRRGEGKEKLVAALTKHHEYADGGCLNPEPVECNELARAAGVSNSTASTFFNDKFQGHTEYRGLCRDSGRLMNALKLLNGEFSPHLLYGRRPPGEDEREDE